MSPNSTFIGDGDVSPNQPTHLGLLADAAAITSPPPVSVGEQVVTPPALASSCTPDTNQLQWINYVTKTGLGQAEANVFFSGLSPFTDLYFISMGPGTGNVFVHLEQVTEDVSSGTLTPSKTEHWFQIQSAAMGAYSFNHIRFNKPVTKFYMTHADLGAQSFFVFLATNDVENYGAR